MLRIVAVLVGVCALAGAALAQDSGFLGNVYSNLQEVQSPSGQKVQRWISPALTPGKYDSLLLDKTVFHPLPKPTDQVSATILNEISAYLDADFKPIIDVWAKDARAFVESAKLKK